MCNALMFMVKNFMPSELSELFCNTLLPLGGSANQKVHTSDKTSFKTVYEQEFSYNFTKAHLAKDSGVWVICVCSVVSCITCKHLAPVVWNSAKDKGRKK